MYERQLLKELEALRSDVNNAAQKVAPSTAPAPRPAHIPKLEDWSRPPPPRAPPPPVIPATNGFHQPRPSIHNPAPNSGPPIAAYNNSDPLGHGPLSHQSPSIPSSSTSSRPITPLSSTVSRSSISSAGPSSPLPPQSPGAGPSKVIVSPNPSEDGGPPLGGRFVEGTKSTLVQPSPLSSPLQSNSASGPPVSRLGASDPLLGSQTVGPSFTSSLSKSDVTGSFDPLGGRPTYMAGSVRVAPNRPRLDPREAASKLANMF